MYTSTKLQMYLNIYIQYFTVGSLPEPLKLKLSGCRLSQFLKQIVVHLHEICRRSDLGQFPGIQYTDSVRVHDG